MLCVPVSAHQFLLVPFPSLTPSLPHCLTHPLSPSFPHSLTTSLTLYLPLSPSFPHSLTASLPHSPPISLTPSLPHSLTASLTPYLPPSLTPSLPHCLTHPLSPSFPHSLTPSLPHSPPISLLSSTVFAVCPDFSHENGNFVVTGQHFDRYTEDTRVTITCNNGFLPLENANEITCTGEGTWKPHPPICAGNITMKRACNLSLCTLCVFVVKHVDVHTCMYLCVTCMWFCHVVSVLVLFVNFFDSYMYMYVEDGVL